MTELSAEAARAVLHWYLEMGVDEAVGDVPTNQFAPPPSPPAAREKKAAPARPVFRPAADAVIPADEAIAAAEAAATAAESHEALEAAVGAFEGCPLKAGASKTVFADGVVGAPLLIIGEAPGRDEDRIGKPFVGRAGQLLDRMLAAIYMSREENVLISNVVYWRPPGNRTPTQTEMAICRPFVDRLIDLTAPRAIALAGGAALQAMLGVTGIMRARGKWREIETASGGRYKTLPMFHPAFLLRQPANKRLAWADLQALEAQLIER
ncbi:MAG: uracil-DNA glycosylase [Pseudomonadota bacterium]